MADEVSPQCHVKTEVVAPAGAAGGLHYLIQCQLELPQGVDVLPSTTAQEVTSAVLVHMYYTLCGQPCSLHCNWHAIMYDKTTPVTKFVVHGVAWTRRCSAHAARLICKRTPGRRRAACEACGSGRQPGGRTSSAVVQQVGRNRQEGLAARACRIEAAADISHRDVFTIEQARLSSGC